MTMWARFIFTGFLFLSFMLCYGQKPVTQQIKSTHLKMLKEGVLLIRLSNQDAKIKALRERGRAKEAEALIEETNTLNGLIVKSFTEYYTYNKIHFIAPDDTKQILKDKSKKLTDIISGESIDLSECDVYFTNFGFGNPAESHERYNRKGFQIFTLEDGQIVHLGRDIFYAGVKQGFLVGSFEKNMVKTIQKMNRRFATGSRYL